MLFCTKKKRYLYKLHLDWKIIFCTLRKVYTTSHIEQMVLFFIGKIDKNIYKYKRIKQA